MEPSVQSSRVSLSKSMRCPMRVFSTSKLTLLDRREEGVERDPADRPLVRARLLLGRDESLAGRDLDLEPQLPVLVDRGDVQIGVQDLDVGGDLEIPRLDFARAPWP